ncbi:polyprenyl synthetase family protein [Nesterenkonia massiliensis]|uniref:Polyprenyl synthetase family protein n=1 Tax=Nesterenkonia massiliensis TaxID=1232429 RepID=A0ABT2HQH0_9MICC|nr:polyprenyl synthetase family protein [Nesterenkonia massiliensis]MCT1606943.1 polyprenyl synthetase family protein [Nesterenkonia massiliensis]
MLRHQTPQQDFAQRAERFVAGVNDLCREYLLIRREEVNVVSAHAAPLADAILDLTAGGKKLRPVLAWIGWRSARSEEHLPAAVEKHDADAAVKLLGVSLELFQAAALVHDDIIDRSATRRGQPSTHKRFETLHREKRYAGETDHFGTTGAILSGDLALAWSGQAFADAQQQARQQLELSAEQLVEVQTIFQRMHTEVMTGQYLDVLAEVGPAAANEAEAVAQARNVLRYKAAKYSSEYPVTLGCALAGGSAQLREALAAATLPVGEAFQLRDDLLGVFGDPAVTGKPVGDDLREGKRTELIAYGLYRSPAAAADELTAMLGRADLSQDDVARAREILITCGAVEEVERSIEALLSRSAAEVEKLHALGVDDEVLHDLEAVTQRLVARTS